MHRTRYSARLILVNIFLALLIALPARAITPSAPAAPDVRADAVVLVNSASGGYADYTHFIKPYLDHFGIPYTVLDIAASQITAAIGDYAVIIAGHRQLDLTGLMDATERGYITTAVNAGTGLVNFDNDLSADGTTARYQYIHSIFGFQYNASTTGSGVTFLDSTGGGGAQINCWDDAHQSPVLATTTDAAALVENDGQWTEFLYTQRGFPSVLASVNETSTLPTMRFYSSGIPNGSYRVMANLYTAGAGRNMRYYYGYSAANPSALSVDTVGGSGGSTEHTEYELGTVDITDGAFNLYARSAELLSGTYGLFGWAWIRLVPTNAPIAPMHYITARHQANESISTGSMTMAGITLPTSVTALASSGGQPFLAVTSYGQGRAVQWGSYNWMSYNVKGPFYGLDDLVWRSIVWAARKPFVMQGLPPFVTMRMDDEQGPFTWIHIANEFGIKPWAGLFFQNISEADAADLSALVHAGQATASVHAFGGTFFYSDHGPNWPDATIAANFQAGTDWHQAHNIPISKFVLAHYYELGSNAFAGLHNWGVEFVGLQMDPGQAYGAPWIMNGPFRRYETGGSSSGVPEYYADFVHVPDHPEFDNQFFNVVTEVRDDAGYEWYPSNDVPLSVGRGTRQLKRALDSMALATLFTHGYYPASITSDNWRTILHDITTNIAGYHPLYVTMDYAAQYVRAMATSGISGSIYDTAAHRLSTTLSGAADMPTRFFLYTEDATGIRDVMVDVPAFTGSTQVNYQVAGALDHIVVSPASPSLVTGGTQQFTALGYDASNNPIPNLPFTWQVVNGGGTIDANGLFTAGAASGTFDNTIVASLGGISGRTSLHITAPALDHFTFATVPSPQYVNTPFQVVITARDSAGNRLMGYMGQANLSDSSGTLTPATTGAFANGVWTGTVSIAQPRLANIITARAGTIAANSNVFDVEEAPAYYRLSSPSYTQRVGVPFSITVSAFTATIDLSADNHQEPVLAQTSVVDTLISNSASALWTEFYYPTSRPYASVMASALHTAGLPLMHFYAVGIPNGRYQVLANVYDNAPMRYFYGLSAATPNERYFDAAGGSGGTQHKEYSLGTITITNGRFDLYTNNAQLINGGYDIFGWAWVKLLPAQADSVTIDITNDANQSPVLPTTSDVATLLANGAAGRWTEFLYTPSRPYPTILASALHTTTLPTLHYFSSNLPNGRYQVFANLYDNAPMRYFYGYTAANPAASWVDVAGGSSGTQHREYSLGMVDISNRSFDLYVNQAQLLQTGGYEFFGWAWIRLQPVGLALSASSAALVFDTNGDGVFNGPIDHSAILTNYSAQVMARGDAALSNVDVTIADTNNQSASRTYHIGEQAPPPPLPASFYGLVQTLYAPAPQAGDTLQVLIPGLASPVTTALRSDPGGLVYSLDVPGDVQGTLAKEGAAEGDPLTFRLNGKVMATAIWHSGTNTALHLHPPLAALSVAGTPLAGAPVTLDAGASQDAGSDITTYAFDCTHDGTFEITQATPQAACSYATTGSYTAGVRVTDAQGGQDSTTVSVNVTLAEHRVSLQPGWNLVSFRLHPTATDIATLLSSLGTNYDLVYAWSGGVWHKYDRLAGFGNDLSTLDEKQGFWIHVTATAPVELVVRGTVPATTDITLTAGWNLVGYPASVNRALPGALSGQGVTLVYAYHAADTGDPWKLYDYAPGSGAGNDLLELTPGWGYWVQATTTTTWHVSNTAP
jgi:hypothetical protein